MMKEAGKIIGVIGLLTAFLLLYVHEQVSLLKLSYELDGQSEALAQKEEAWRRLKFEVDELKAPRLLEEKMRELSLDLTLPKEIKVIRIPPAPRLPGPQVMEKVSLSPLPKHLVDFVGRWVDVAQATTENE